MSSFEIISKKHGTFTVLIDAEDYERVIKYTWCISKESGSDLIYVLRKEKSGEKYKTILLHRDLVNVPEGKVVDHINHDGLDNRKSNLRICDQRDNVKNCRKRQYKSTSKYKGVHFFKNYKKFVAVIQSHQKRRCIGYYHKEEDAARAYNVAAIKYHGEFANLNIIGVE